MEAAYAEVPSSKSALLAPRKLTQPSLLWKLHASD